MEIGNPAETASAAFLCLSLLFHMCFRGETTHTLVSNKPLILSVLYELLVDPWADQNRLCFYTFTHTGTHTRFSDPVPFGPISAALLEWNF